MKNLLLKVSVKFGLLFGVISIISRLIADFTFNPEVSIELYFNIVRVPAFVFASLLIILAHYEFNKKNYNFISFKDAILIGFIIIGISFVISSIYIPISYEFFMNEIMQIHSETVILGTKGGGVFENSSLLIIFLNHILFLLPQAFLLLIIITFESKWKIYKKAGKKGWESIVPIYSTFVLLEIVKKPFSWFFLLLIPVVNIIIYILIISTLSKRFGKNNGFTLGLILLPFIFYPLLGLSKAGFIDD